MQRSTKGGSMRMKKIVAWCSVLVLSVSMLAGCGQENTADISQEEATEMASAVKPEDVEEIIEEEVEKSGGGYDRTAIENAGEITITMMMSGVATENDFETEQLPALIKERWPNVTLEVTKLPDDNYYTALKTRLASGEAPDIIGTQPMWAGQNSCYALAEAGYLAPLNDLEAVNYIGDLSALTYNGDLVAFSNGVAILGTYYNKDMFEECGITSEPATWSELLDACEAIAAKGYQPIVMGDKDMYVLQFGLYQIAANEIYANNPDYDAQLRTGETKFTDEGTWDKVLTMYNELYENGYIDASQSLGTGASQAITEFIDGRAAMTFDGSFNAGGMTAIGAGGEFERGYFPIPSESGNNQTATCLGGGFGIYSGSDYIDECKAIIDYWNDGSSDAWHAYVDTGRIIPAYGEGADTAPNSHLYAPFIDMYNEGKGFHWCNQAWPAGTETVMQELFSEMVGGQGTTVQEITQGMQDKFEDLLDE